MIIFFIFDKYYFLKLIMFKKKCTFSITYAFPYQNVSLKTTNQLHVDKDTLGNVPGDFGVLGEHSSNSIRLSC